MLDRDFLMRIAVWQLESTAFGEIGVKSYAVTGDLSSRLKSCPRNFPIHLGSTAKQSVSNCRL